MSSPASPAAPPAAREPSPGSAALLQQALALAGQRDLMGADAACQTLLRDEPDYAEAHHLRGMLLWSMGRRHEAVESFERVLRLRPGEVQTLSKRGHVLLELARYGEALADFEQLQAIAPMSLHILNGRGIALRRLGRLEEALECFQTALRQDPHSPEALTNQGAVLLQLHRPEAALASLDRAVAIRPDFRLALGNRGSVLLELGRAPEALACFDACLASVPHDADVLCNRGNALRILRRHEEAVLAYERALILKPHLSEALMNLGVVLGDLQRHEQAAQAFRRLRASGAEFDYSAGSLLFAEMSCADWSGWSAARERLCEAALQSRRVVFPFPMLSFTHSAQQQRACAQLYVADRCASEGLTLYAGEHYAHERIRVAYLSADFREHAVAHVAAGVFEQHDRGRFETIALALQAHPHPSRMRERLRAAFAQFYDVSALSDREAAQLLRRLEVDIAVDLTGHTTGGRPGILAFRPAPIQVNYLGFPGTLGAPYIDYLIADPIVIPAHEEPAYLERIVRLPHCYLPNDARPAAAPANPPTRSANALPEHGVVFCAFNNTYKINPDLFSVWMRLLQRTPESVLWLRAAEPLVTVNLRREALAWGIAPERLVFAPYLEDLEQHLARYALVDLFLDTLPYNAHATANDALRAGVPVITCRGSTFAGRVAASQLTALGVPELITESLPEYEALAARLASDPQARVQLRAKILAHQSTHPLFNTSLYRQHLESAFLTMHQRHQQRLPPQGFEVAPNAAAMPG
jgi:predicted O-linked N-acetylglucosamine transferase (SPINDLY family)